MKQNITLFDQLKREHQEVDKLIVELAGCDPEERPALVERIEELLIPHARAEEKTLYAAMAQKEHEERDSDNFPLIADAYEEHSEADNLLSDMLEMTPGDDEWAEKIANFRRSIQHHVREEETQIFNRARELLTEDELFGLHEAYRTEKANYEESLPTQDQINAKQISSAAASALHQ